MRKANDFSGDYACVAATNGAIVKITAAGKYDASGRLMELPDSPGS